MLSYNDILEQLEKLDEEKRYKLAFITHYIQTQDNNSQKYFRSSAKQFIEELNLSESYDGEIPFKSNNKYSFTFIDLFAGIGGMRIAFQNIGGKCVFSSEWEKNAQKTYAINFGEVPFGDITKINEKDVPEHDILVAGFPCQAFSIAGHRGGFDDTRGTLFFDVARIIKEKQPKAFFLENVKGLTNHDGGKTLEVILNTLRNDLDYFVTEPKIINAKDFGVPQNRERIYIVGFRKDLGIKMFSYPKATNKITCLNDILEKEVVSTKYYLSTQYLGTLVNHKARHESKGNGFGYEIIPTDGVANAIIVGGMGRERNLIIDNRITDFTPVTKIKGEVNRESIRKMTPREWARLQGFPDNFKIKVSDAQAYKQFGNSVAVPAVQATAQKLLDTLKNSGVLKDDFREVRVMQEGVCMIKGNKGEWSEIYTLIKLLSEGKLYAADSDLQKIEEIYYPIIKILRKDNGNWEYKYGSNINVVDGSTGNTVVAVPVATFIENSRFLLKNIKQAKGSSFTVPQIESFMTDIKCTTLKAKAADKRDITIVVHDMKTELNSIFGFSIKSELGDAPTLLNPGKTTNFIYQIEGNLTGVQIAEINGIDTKSKIKDRVKAIRNKYNCSLKYSTMENENFLFNLQVIDSQLPVIVSELLLLYYGDNGMKLDEMTEKLTVINPCKFKQSSEHPFYRYKVKSFLTDIALGMTPSKPWKGMYDATGGYIIVKKDGEVLCYHLYNKNEFQEYLIKNTKFETPSSSRYGFGQIYKENDALFIKLNLQVRFI